ncbi:MAG TPA: PilZ domain-containing protein [Pseudoxanthomonas sp.]|nr:PilZ domain-containing protein [Pseudoxanthomonas sp.]
MINESRRAERRNVHESVAVIDSMTEQVIGRLGNISESGMLLVASAQLHDDALYQLRFEIIDRTGHMVAIHVGAHLLWVGSANTPGQSWAGLRFLTVEESQLAVLRHWISRPESRV